MKIRDSVTKIKDSVMKIKLPRCSVLKISLQTNLRTYPWIIGSIVVTSIIAAILHANIFVILGSALLMAATLLIKIQPTQKTHPLLSLPILFASAFLIFILMQFTIGAGFGKYMNFAKFMLNVIIIFGMELLVFAASSRVNASILSVLIFSETLGIIDHFVVQTRQMEIGYNDIFSVLTGLSVAGSYKFTLSPMTLGGLLFSIPFAILIIRTKLPIFRIRYIRIISSVLAAVTIVVPCLVISSDHGSDAIDFKDKYWKFRASEYNGFYVNFIHTAAATKVKVPENYSRDELIRLLKELYGVDVTPPQTGVTPIDPPSTDEITPPVTGAPTAPSTTPDTSDDKQNPNIIVIMDETFSDLQAVSEYLYNKGKAKDNLLTVENVLPFFNSLSSTMPNVEKGWATSSVFGGNTANSELEFLTGHSLAFLPANTVAYNLYLNKNNSFSIVDLLNKEGYLTVGMHPEAPTNWSRDKIYSYYGFNEILFEDDFTGLTDKDYYRGHVSDAAVFDKIIDMYESKDKGTPLFTFAVTMMNHGGFSTEGFEPTIHLQNYTKYKGTQEYLSSINKTDEALRELIEYFTNADEETVIVFFGDHQPSLSASFYSNFFGIDDDSDARLNQAKYAVPYLIWANFDFESDDSEITSLNYLSGKALDIAGIEKTEYLSFISMVREEYPAISAAGYWDTSGNFYSFSDYSAEDSSLLRLYKYLQYNALFDSNENKLTHWFVKGDVPAPSITSTTTNTTSDIPAPVTAPITGKKEQDE